MAQMSQIESTFVHAYRELLLRYTDELDMGWREPGGDTVTERRTNPTLEKNKRGEGRPDQLSLELLRQHLTGEAVLHTHPLRGAGKIWLQVDIDAHKGQTDAPAVASFICELFHGSYHEPSTGGKGIHLYMWVNDFRDMERYNSLLGKCEVLLGRLLRHHGYAATVEFKHTFTIMHDGEVQERGRGQLAKAPRLPDGMASLQKFHTAPVWPLPKVVSIIKGALTSGGLPTNVSRKIIGRGA